MMPPGTQPNLAAQQPMFGQNNAGKSNKTKKILILFGSIVGGLALLALAGFLLLNFFNGAPKYGELKDITVGSRDGEKVTLSVPKEMEEEFSTSFSAPFTHKSPHEKDGQTLVYSQIQIQSQFLGVLGSENVQQLKDSLINKDADYDELVQELNDDPEIKDLQFEDFKEIKTDGIPDGIMAGFTYTSETTDTKGKGTLLYAFGKQNFYVVAINGDAKVIDKNSGTWEKIINGIKVDQ